MPVTLTITFANGSTEERPYSSYYTARLFARDNISYTGGKIARVTISNDTGSVVTPLWDATWSAVSQYHGLWDGI